MSSFQTIADNTIINDFELKPQICIGKVVGDACEMKVKLTWSSVHPLNLCLFQNKTQLKCWQEKSKVTEYISIKVTEQSEFSLTQFPPGKVLAKQAVQINYQVNDKYRRRLRSEWSIF